MWWSSGAVNLGYHKEVVKLYTDKEPGLAVIVCVRTDTYTGNVAENKRRGIEMEIETKITAGLALMWTLSIVIYLVAVFDLPHFWRVIVFVTQLAVAVYTRYQSGKADKITFIICDRDEYNTIDEDDLDIEE